MRERYLEGKRAQEEGRRQGGREGYREKEGRRED